MANRKSSTMRILMNLCRILRPNSKLNFHFLINTTIAGGDVLAAAVTQHIFQISIQNKCFRKHVKGTPHKTLC
jgi:hypothetical protein